MRSAIVLNGKADDEVLRLAQITNLCQALHCLPQPGGLFDQDPYLVNGMRIVLEAQAERQEKDSKSKSKFRGG